MFLTIPGNSFQIIHVYTIYDKIKDQLDHSHEGVKLLRKKNWIKMDMK